MHAYRARTTDAGLGFMGTREAALAIWEAAASRWSRVPRRPTPGDVTIYRRLAGRRLAGSVLILGVTPELRDLVAEAGARPVIVDSSSAMYEATSRMLGRSDPAHETVIETDWCEADLPGGAVGSVLGAMRCG